MEKCSDSAVVTGLYQLQLISALMGTHNLGAH